MGVMACGRKDCTNILCDRYSSEYGYICDSCYKELKALGSSISIEEFMSTPKRHKYTGIDAADVFIYTKED